MFLKSTLKVLSSSPDLVSQTLKVDKSCESWNLGNDLERGWGRECKKRRKTPFFLIFNPTENANTSKTPRTPEESTGFLEFTRNRQSRKCEKNFGIRDIFLAFTR